jgi:hypothetical protein
MEEKFETNKKPPVDIEQWVDLIIASAAHRSHDEGQRKFGELLLQRYFVEIPKDYTSDPIAKRYLDNMLCAVASAIRGFSVARDLFETQWSTIREAKTRERARAERLDAFSPFKPDGYWKQIVLIIGSLGILSPILASFKNVIGNLPWQIVLFIALGCVVSLVLMELFVDILRNSRLARVEKKYPDDLLSVWLEKTLGGYRTVCQQFLLLAIKIREEYYPELSTYHGSKIYDRYAIPHFDFDSNQGTATDFYELNQFLSSVVEQHFAFKVKPKTTSDDNKSQT